MTKNPWMKWYPSDWRADPLVRSCEPMTRYVWFEMLGLMHEAEPYGHLVLGGRAMDYKTLSRLVAVEVGEVKRAVKELIDRGVCNRTDDGVIFSRRMIRDKNRSEIAAEHGKRGGNPSFKKQRDNPSTLKGRVKGEDKPQKPEATFQKEEASIATNAPRDPPRPAAAAPPRSPPLPDDEIQQIEARCRAALAENAPSDPVRHEMVDLARRVGVDRLAAVLACETRRPRKRPVRGWKLWATIAAEKLDGETPAAAPPSGEPLDPGEEMIEYDHGRRMKVRQLEMVLRRYSEQPSSWLAGWGPPPEENPRLLRFAAERGIEIRAGAFSQ